MTGRLATPALGLAALVLLAALALELAPGLGTPELPVAAPRPAASHPAEPGAAPDTAPQAEAAESGETSRIASWVATSLARPLFAQSRRPAPAEAGPAAAAGPGLPRLAGVMVGPFGRRAIFAAPEVGKPLVVEEGGSIGTWHVQHIAVGEVTLAGPEGTPQVLRPSFDKDAPPPPRPAAVPPILQVPQVPGLPGQAPPPAPLPGFAPGVLPGQIPAQGPGQGPGLGGMPGQVPPGLRLPVPRGE